MDRLTWILSKSDGSRSGSPKFTTTQILDIENEIGKESPHFIYFIDKNFYDRFTRFHFDVNTFYRKNKAFTNPENNQMDSQAEEIESKLADKLVDQINKSDQPSVQKKDVTSLMDILTIGGFILPGSVGFPRTFLNNYKTNYIKKIFDSYSFPLVKAWILLVDFYLDSKNWQNHRFSEPFELNFGFIIEKCLLFNYLVLTIFQRKNINTDQLKPFKPGSRIFYLNNPNSPLEKAAQKYFGARLEKVDGYHELMLPNYESKTNWRNLSKNSEKDLVDDTPKTCLFEYQNLSVLKPFSDDDLIFSLCQAYDQEGLINQILFSAEKVIIAMNDDQGITPEHLQIRIIIAAILQQLTAPDFYKFITI